MKQTIYVDVLIIINIYINYGLLLLTSAAVKTDADRLRLLLASLFGGVYSLIILVPDISDLLISVSRAPALAVMVFLAYGYGGRRKYIRKTLIFFGINLAFAGAMLLLWLFFCPQNMYFNSGVVYFGIDALALVLLTIGAYVIIRLISLLGKGRVPRGLTYSVTVFLSGRELICRGFYDSGNTLCDPFSGEGVTVVNIDLFSGIIEPDVFETTENADRSLNMKLIPVSTLSGTQLLPSFRADRIRIKGIETDIILERPVIALCREKIHGGEYGALLYSSVFENSSKGKGEAYVCIN